MSWTTADLLTSIKNRAAVPEDQTNFPDATLLKLADEETASLLMPAILKHREEWMTFDYDYTLTTTQTSYRIPSRAFGGKLRLLTAIDTTGQKTFPTRITPERSQEFVNFNSTAKLPTHYCLKHGSVVIEPAPSVDGATLRMTYYRRPSKLVATTAVGTVSAINFATNQVTVTGAPGGFIGYKNYDLVRANPEFDGLAIDMAAAVVAGSTITFDSVPADLEYGDYVTLAGETPVPQIPADLHPILAQMVACRILASLGFLDQLKAAREDLAAMLDSAGITLQSRDEGSSLKVSRLGGR